MLLNVLQYVVYITTAVINITIVAANIHSVIEMYKNRSADSSQSTDDKK
jgi:hypothetical protein